MCILACYAAVFSRDSFSQVYNKTHHTTQDMQTGKENGQSEDTRVEENRHDNFALSQPESENGDVRPG